MSPGRWTIAALVLAGLGLWSAAQADTAFAKFSPLPQFATADLTADPAGGRPLSVAFGTQLPLLEALPEAARVRLPDGTDTWVRRSDVFVSPDGRVIGGGAGFATTERPKLRFWQDHAALSAFLGREDGTATDADFEEVLTRRPDFDPVFPVVASDVTAVAGRKAQRIASVLLPVHGATSDALARLAGTGQSSFDIHFLVDVSGDALPFAQEVLATLAQDLSRRLSDDPNDYRLSLTLFGNNLPRGFRASGRVDWAELGERPTAARDTSGRWTEPVLKALGAAIPAARDGRTRAVLVILSGADLQATETSEALGGRITLDTMEPQIPADVTVIVAQITPEPAAGLARLAERLRAFARVEYVPFESGLGRSLSGRIQNALGFQDDRRIEPEEMGQICTAATAAGLLCFLPYAATTADRLPPPPVAPTKPDWYSTVVWLVVEGLNLEFLAEETAP